MAPGLQETSVRREPGSIERKLAGWIASVGARYYLGKPDDKGNAEMEVGYPVRR